MSSSSDQQDTFTVKLRGVSIPITRPQIEADSPGSNLFFSSLLGDFVEAQNKTMSLDRHPGIFKMILDHLSGYSIFPLDEQYIRLHCGPGMSERRVVDYLYTDTMYYGFDRLFELVREVWLEKFADDAPKPNLDYQEKMLAIEQAKLNIEKKRLKNEIKVINDTTARALDDRRLQLLSMKLNVELKRLQAKATVTANKPVGAASLGADIQTNIDNLVSLVENAFSGGDVFEPGFDSCDRAYMPIEDEEEGEDNMEHSH